jgi:transposase
MHVQDHLTPDELQQAAGAIADKRTWLRFQAVILAQQGRSAPEIARALGCSRRAVQSWVARYNRGGVQALHERPHTGRPARLSGPDLRRFEQRIEDGPRPEDGTCTLRGPEIRRILEQEFGVILGRQATYDLLHRLGFSDLMPRPQHPGSNEEVQEFFREIVVEQIAAIAERHPGDEVRVWFEDEARFGQQGTLTRVWARRGSRPRAVRPQGRLSLYALAAVCVATGSVSAMLVEKLDTETLNAFLGQISRGLPPGEHAVLIWDGAGYHTAAGLEVPGNISLILLPPYSPELNPVENLWHYLRSHHWSNRAYRDYEELESEASRSMSRVCLDAEKVKSICNAPYICAGA